MEALTLGLLLLAAVLASSLIDQIIPRVSLPLIQIAIGCSSPSLPAAMWK